MNPRAGALGLSTNAQTRTPSGTLRELIFQHYARSALLPILTIEVLLLAVYFITNAYHARQTEKTLKNEVVAVMPHLVGKTAAAINDNFAMITRQTRYYAAAHAELYRHPEAFDVPGEKPVFAKAPNGALYQTNRPRGSSLFIAATRTFDTRQLLFAEKTAALDQLSEHMVRDVPNVVAAYINTPDNMNRLYPFIDKVYEQYPADLNMADYNFFYLADPRHDPQHKPVWTGVYLDPAGQGWMLSCVAPVYSSDTTFEGVVGLDVTVNNIVNNVLHMELPWGASAFMTDSKGMILAMSREVEALLGLKELKSHVYNTTVSKEQLKPEEFNLLKSRDPLVAQTFRTIFAGQAPVREVTISGHELFLVQSVIPETGWRLMVLLKKADVYTSVNRLIRISRLVGGLIVVGMILFYILFFIFLRGQARKMATAIADPVSMLTKATAEIGTEKAGGEITQSGIQELDQLTDTFNTMSRELDRRSKALVDAQVRVQIQEKEAELAFARGQYESASGYLHNVGNAITRFDSHLMDIEEILRSTSQYPDVFRRVRDGDQDVLHRFEEVLLRKTIPGLRAAVTGIAGTKNTIEQTIAHQQADFNATHQQFKREPFPLSDLVKELCDEYLRDVEKAGISLVRDIRPGIVVVGHSYAFRQGIQNLIKNALEATPAGGTITVTCAQGPDSVEITVSDTGRGIAAADLPQVMSAGFTTKPNGHGLGLHTFAVLLSAEGGRLSVTSAGPGRGTCVRTEVRHG